MLVRRQEEGEEEEGSSNSSDSDKDCEEGKGESPLASLPRTSISERGGG